MFSMELKPAPLVKATINVGCGLDIPTGTWHKGKFGENLLNGGLGFVTGITSVGNQFKSTLLHYLMLSAASKIMETHATRLSTYDTETNVHENRLISLSQAFDIFKGRNLIDEGIWTTTDKTVYLGNEYFELIKAFIRRKTKESKKVNTPFVDRDKTSFMQIYVPTFDEIDSLTEFQSASELTMLEENELGDSGANTFHMRSGLVKQRLLMELPALAGSGYHYTLMTAQLGKESAIAAGPHSAPPTKKLNYLKNNDKIKGVTDKFTFATTNCMHIYNMSALVNQSTKAAEYPVAGQDPMSGDTDLNELSIRFLRSKSGPSGIELKIVVSQKEGILPSLTEFHFIKGYNRFGITGTLQHYALDLYPDVKLQRTTVRSKIDSDRKLRRALNITSEIAQMKLYMQAEVGDQLMEPKDLYQKIKDAGYDWDFILENTRGYWTLDNEKNPVPYLSSLDLLEMAAGKYHPYWMEADKTVKKDVLKRLEEHRKADSSELFVKLAETGSE